MWIKREIEDILKTAAVTRPAIILTGCRQTGKTSLLKHAFPKYNYVALDVPTTAQEADTAGNSFLSKHKPPIIIDEVQYAPNLLRWIKRSIDENRDINGQFLITGSQSFPLMEGVTESLAGRSSVLQCHSLSAREFEKWSGNTIEGTQLLEWIFRGGYPELQAKQLDPERFYSDYLATYLERDVRTALNVRNLRDFDRFMRLCASRSGQLLSYSSLATDVGVMPNTIKNWISVLSASNIIYLLEPYFQNLGKRIVKSPKLYFLDTGLMCFLQGMKSPDDISKSALLGSIFETHVLAQIVRSFANTGKTVALYYYRDHHGNEVDFLIPVGDRFKLMECKWSETPPARIKGFDEISRLTGDARIISRTVITPLRGSRTSSTGISVQDSIDIDLI